MTPMYNDLPSDTVIRDRALAGRHKRGLHGSVNLLDAVKDVKAFHTKYNRPMKGEILIDWKQAQFRADLLWEEVDELESALPDRPNYCCGKQERSEGDLVEVLDAAIDIIYVTLGTAVAAGLTPEQIEAAWNEVHLSNMEKVALDGKSKLVKPAGWVPPRLKEILE